MTTPGKTTLIVPAEQAGPGRRRVVLDEFMISGERCRASGTQETRGRTHHVRADHGGSRPRPARYSLVHDTASSCTTAADKSSWLSRSSLRWIRRSSTGWPFRTRVPTSRRNSFSCRASVYSSARSFAPAACITSVIIAPGKEPWVCMDSTRLLGGRAVHKAPSPTARIPAGKGA